MNNPLASSTHTFSLAISPDILESIALDYLFTDINFVPTYSQFIEIIEGLTREKIEGHLLTIYKQIDNSMRSSQSIVPFMHYDLSYCMEGVTCETCEQTMVLIRREVAKQLIKIYPDLEQSRQIKRARPRKRARS